MTSSDQPLHEALSAMIANFASQTRGDDDEAPAPPIANVTKYGSTVLISNEEAMDLGLIPDTRPPVHIPIRVRLRWRIREGLAAARMRAGSRIAGVDLDHECGC